MFNITDINIYRDYAHKVVQNTGKLLG